MYEYAKRFCVKERTDRDEKSEPESLFRDQRVIRFIGIQIAPSTASLSKGRRLVFGIDTGKSAAGRL